MEKRIFYWPKSVYINALLQIIMYSAGIVFVLGIVNFTSPEKILSNGLSIFFSAVTIIISSFTLILKLIFPEMEYEAGIIKFNGEKDGVVRRRNLVIYSIDTVIETKRVSAGFVKSKELPSFIIKTKNGDEYEFWPLMKKENKKRIDQVIQFLRSCPGMPPIESDKKNLIRPDL